MGKTKKQQRAEDGALKRRCDWEIGEAQKRFNQQMVNVTGAYNLELYLLDRDNMPWAPHNWRVGRQWTAVTIDSESGDLRLTYTIQVGSPRTALQARGGPVIYRLNRRVGFSRPTRGGQSADLIVTSELEEIMEKIQADLIVEQIKELG